MKLLSVNVSLGQEVPYKGKTVTTGIFKKPVNGRVMLRTLNLDGDRQVDLKGHGGPFKAVCVYSIEQYEYWQKELGRDDFSHGQFGENFTVDEMPDDKTHVGDVFRVGNTLVQVTQPRVPCYRLGIKMGSSEFVKRFLQSNRVGFYMRVLQEGEVGAGDLIELVETDAQRMTVEQMNRLLYFDPKNVDDAKRALCIDALSPGWRGSFEQRLEKAGFSVEFKEQPENGPCCGP